MNSSRNRDIGILSGLGAALLFALTGMIVKEAVSRYGINIFQLGFLMGKSRKPLRLNFYSLFFVSIF